MDALTGKVQTYADMSERSIKCALWLKKQGVKPGDIIGLCSDNNLDVFLVLLGTMYIGAISNTWDHELSLSKYFILSFCFAIVLSENTLRKKKERRKNNETHKSKERPQKIPVFQSPIF